MRSAAGRSVKICIIDLTWFLSTCHHYEIGETMFRCWFSILPILCYAEMDFLHGRLRRLLWRDFRLCLGQGTSESCEILLNDC